MVYSARFADVETLSAVPFRAISADARSSAQKRRLEPLRVRREVIVRLGSTVSNPGNPR
jgi:hypothetical protein